MDYLSGLSWSAFWTYLGVAVMLYYAVVIIFFPMDSIRKVLQKVGLSNSGEQQEEESAKKEEPEFRG